MIKFLLTNLKDTIVAAKSAIVVIIFSISLTTTIILSFYSMLSESVVSIENIQYDSRNYQIGVANSEKISNMATINKVLFGNYPKILNAVPFSVRSFQVTEADEEYKMLTGCDKVVSTTQFDGYPVVHDSFCTFLYIPSPNILEGRWFTDEEILNGDDVIVLSKSWLQKNMPEASYKIGDGYVINDEQFKIIGFTDGVDEVLEAVYLPQPNYIPYKTMLKHESDSNGFNVYGGYMHVEFERPLSKNERLDIAALFGNEHGSNIPMSQVDIAGSSYYLATVLVFVIAIVMVFISTLNIIGLHKSVLQLNIYRYMVYKICGATNKFISKAIRFTTYAISLCSTVIGSLIYLLFSNVLPKEYGNFKIGWFAYLIMGLTVIFCNELIIRPVIKSVSQKQPIDRSMWR